MTGDLTILIEILARVCIGIAVTTVIIIIILAILAILLIILTIASVAT